MDKPYKVVQVLAVNTPGPWVENACEIQAPDGTPICEMLSRPEDSGVNYPFSPVADSNSRLICAAPDMLALCKRLVETVTVARGCDWKVLEHEYVYLLTSLEQEATHILKNIYVGVSNAQD